MVSEHSAVYHFCSLSCLGALLPHGLENRFQEAAVLFWLTSSLPTTPVLRVIAVATVSIHLLYNKGLRGTIFSRLVILALRQFSQPALSEWYINSLELASRGSGLASLESHTQS